MFGIVRTAKLLGIVALAIAALGCRDEPAEAPAPAASTDRPAPTASSEAAAEVDLGHLAYLEDALLEASYDTATLARLARAMPRPSPEQTPLVDLFGGIVDAFVGDPEARLEALGLQPNARVHLSLRALDGRAAAVRKLFGELARDAAPKPELVADLGAQARVLGVHLRAILPTTRRDRLLRALKLLTITDADVGAVAEACASLDDVALCSGRERVIVWARPVGDDRLRVDGVYLFYDGARADDLARALERADDLPATATAPAYEPGPRPGMQALIHAEATRELLRMEALADGALAFAGGEGEDSFDAYLDRERALRELVPDDRVFDGLGLDLDDVDDRLELQLRWLAAGAGGASVAELFAPVVERGALPVVRGDCETAQACLRVGGLSSMLPRFSDLATGPFADTTGMFRVLRQSGDRGLILLGLSAWPNVLGTAGRLATRASRGVTGKAVSELLADSYGFGLYLLELGDEAAAEGGEPERWVGYLRVGADALEAVRPAAALAGLGTDPIEVAEARGATVERSRYDDTWVYLVDEATRRGGFGGWILAADSDARVGWLLETPRDIGDSVEVDPLWYLRVASLGPVAAHEGISYAEDPPIRRWLDGRSLELRASVHADGPHVEIIVGPG